MKKSRHFYLHPETNPGKIAVLESLHAEYVSYVRICVQAMAITSGSDSTMAEPGL